MNTRRIIYSLVFFCAFAQTSNVRADQGVSLSRLSVDYRNYDFYPDASIGIRGDFSWTQGGVWGARAGILGLQRYGVKAIQGALGGSYWFTPTWSFDLDVDAATSASILALFSVTAGTSITISNSATPSMSYSYAHYDDASWHTITPAFTWSIIPQIDLTCKMDGSLARYINGKTAGTISGSARFSFAPFDYFSIFTAYSVGEQPFDPGDPRMPLSRYFANKISGGFKFVMEGHLGAEVNVGQEWRNNGQNVFYAEFASFYRW